MDQYFKPKFLNLCVILAKSDVRKRHCFHQLPFFQHYIVLSYLLIFTVLNL